MKRALLLFTMLMVTGSLVFAQQRTISGKIVGSDGSPIPAATVQIKGTSSGTTADVQGVFRLQVPANATLIVRSIGYNTQEVAVGNRTSLTITLLSSSQNLNELVVTALGIKREARSLGYATTTVSSKDLNVSRPVNAVEGLNGRVAGLQINTINNGVDPGTRIVLRGNRHINSDNQALVVVDGEPVPNSFLSTIDPSDIQSISVLKGASAAALYGAEASNGVLMVTTKRGSQGGKPTIHFSSTVTMERISYFPKLQTRFGGYGGETGTEPWNPSYNYVDPYTGFPNYVPYENQSYGPEFNGDTTLAGRGYIGGPEADGTFYKVPYSAQKKDQRIHFFVTGITTQNDLSYSGGDAKNSYFISVQDVNIKGVTPNDAARRDAVRFAGKKTYDKFSADYSVDYSRKTTSTAGGDFGQGRPVYWNVLNTPANVPLESLKNLNSEYADVNGYYNAYYPNPYWQINNSRNNYAEDNFDGTLNLDLQVTSALKLHYRVGAILTNGLTHDYTAAVSFSPYALSDPWQAGNIPSSVKHKNGSVFDANDYNRRLQQDFIISFDKKYGHFSTDAFVGNTIWDRYRKYISTGSSDIFVPNFYNISARLGQPSANEFISDERRIGAFADVTEGYKNYLFLHAGFRRDWSSLLASKSTLNSLGYPANKGNNAYNFYVVDASWVFTDAIPSLKDNNVLSYGKLRAAYSNTGQISVGPYNIENVVVPPYGFPFGSTPALQLSSQYNNPNLKPEKTQDKEVGLELGFWNDKLSLAASYYNDITTNQTFPVDLSTATGYSSAYVNGGSIKSAGEELGVNLNDIVKTATGFSWSVGGNVSFQQSKVLSLYGGNKDFQVRYGNGGGSSDHAVVGQPYPVLEVNDLVRDPATGKVIVNSSGYPTLDPATKIVGQATPKVILGLNTTLKYKNLSLTAVGDYRGGNQFYAFLGQQLDFTGASQHTAQNGRQSFLFPNSEVSVNGKLVPNTTQYVRDGNIGFWVGSDYTAAGTSYIISGDVWKIRTVSLTYDFSNWIRRTKFVKAASFSVYGNDLFMFRPSQNVWTDPEFNVDNSNAAGITDYNQLPPTRKIGASLDLTF